MSIRILNDSSKQEKLIPEEAVSIKKKIGAKLKSYRENLNLKSVEEFCFLVSESKKAPQKDGKNLMLDESRYRKWEYGINPISFEWIPALCDVFNCDVSSIYGIYPEKTFEVHEVCNYTGLSEKSVEKLNSASILSDSIGVLNALIENSNFLFMLENYAKAAHIKDAAVKNINAYRKLKSDLSGAQIKAGMDTIDGEEFAQTYYQNEDSSLRQDYNIPESDYFSSSEYADFLALRADTLLLDCLRDYKIEHKLIYGHSE